MSDFKTTTENYYYVDKTLLIRDFLDAKPMVSLFTRPRRFGKTLNMDMLRAFFEKTDADTSVLFKDKKIWQCGDAYTRHQAIFSGDAERLQTMLETFMLNSISTMDGANEGFYIAQCRRKSDS